MYLTCLTFCAGFVVDVFSDLRSSWLVLVADLVSSTVRNGQQNCLISVGNGDDEQLSSSRPVSVCNIEAHHEP